MIDIFYLLYAKIRVMERPKDLIFLYFFEEIPIFIITL